jgi:SAM-dependent methyltransferase
MNTPDEAFAKYAEAGAYHWREVSGHWIHHHAFTAERYRLTLAAAGELRARRVLDYGCGDGALLAIIARRAGPAGEAHGFDPNPVAVKLAAQMLQEHYCPAKVHSTTASLPDEYFDVVICAEVIEHVLDVGSLLATIHRVLKPGGTAVITTPVRMTERPEDPNHLQEWYPDQFVEVLRGGPLQLQSHRQVIPAAAAEVYYWRPRFLLRAPVFRLMCNLFSIYAQVNALTALRMRPRLFMMQIGTLRKEPVDSFTTRSKR